jgi:hypothetical protein
MVSSKIATSAAVYVVFLSAAAMEKPPENTSFGRFIIP